MKILLDTHTVLWFLAGDKRMSRKARHVIESSDNTRFLSDASLWEISIKQSLGKLRLSQPFDTLLAKALKRNAIESLAIEKSHIFGVADLPFHHRDPFDRLLIPNVSNALQKCTGYSFIKQRVMEINIDYQNLTKNEFTKTLF